MRTELFEKIRFWLIAAIAIMIPLHQWIVSMLSILLLLVFITGVIGKKFRFQRENTKGLFLFAGFYLLLALTMFYSEHKQEGLFDLQVKLSLIGFPICFSFGSPLSRKQIFLIFYAFITGAVIAACICLVHAVLSFSVSHIDSDLFYSSLSYYYHPSYMSMIAVMAVLLCIHLITRTAILPIRLGIYIAFLILVFFIVMLQSKAGIISAVTLIPFYILLNSFRFKKWILGSILVISSVGVYFFTNNVIITRSNDRLLNATYNITHLEEVRTTGGGAETSEVRIQIWKTILHLIKENWAYGVGIGDVKYVLKDRYKENKLDFAYEHELNAHNEYLQIALATGVGGFLLMISGFLIPVFRSMKRRQYIYLLFLVLVTFNISVESMFESSIGCIFYGFFNSLFFFLMNDYRTEKNSIQ